MEPGSESELPPDDQRLWNAITPELATAIRSEAAALALAMTEQARTTLPELLADADDVEANRASSETTLRAMADMLERRADPYEATLPETTRVWVIDSARRGQSLPGLMRIYRISHAVVWNWILTRLRAERRHRESFEESIGLVSEWLLAYVDALVILAEDLYGSERERWLRSNSAIRMETLNEILTGNRVDATAASRRLGYELDRTHLALVGWRVDAGEEQERFDEVEAALKEVAAVLASGEPLIHPIGVMTTAAWIGSDEAIDLELLADAVVDPGTGLRIATGYPGAGVAGFRRSHREALAARRIGVLGGSAPGTVLRFTEVAFAATATVEVGDSWRFVRRELGALAATDEASLRLLETLRVYFSQGCSHRHAAARLGVHENTVRYRVRQCEERLERTIGPEDFNLQAALVLVDAIPAIVAEQPPSLVALTTAPATSG